MTNPSPQQTYKQYKIRKLSWNSHGEVYGFTIPKPIALMFEDVKFRISTEDGKIVLTSGLDLVKFRKEAHKYNIADY